VNWQHLQAIVWMRWRLLVNQWRRSGSVEAILMTIVAIGALVIAIPLLIGSVMLGIYLIPRAAPVQLMYAWDALIVVFLFFWSVGLVAELQRTEPLSLAKLMHLPVSITGAFLINYLSSLLRLSLIVFVPVMLGFSLALVWTNGILLLPVLASLLAFLLMITALTYQFQGWLAALMSNPRRRRTIVVAATMSVVLVAQLPNLLNFIGPWETRRRADRTAALAHELAKLNRALEAHQFDASEFARRKQEITHEHRLAVQQADRASAQRWAQTARLVNLILPLGWLPLGVMTAAEGHVLPSILGLLGMTLIGTASLYRAYRTTLGLYQGRATNRKGRPAPDAAARAHGPKRGRLLLEARVAGLSEPVSAIALGGLRSLLRSPEAKLMLLTPLLMSVVFGSLILRGRQGVPIATRPLVAFGAMVVVLFGVLQLMVNQFGFDRDGFRVFVLCAAPRKDILLGKNLAFAPLALGMAALLLAVVQVVCPMRLDHFLAVFPQFVSMYLLFCILTNFLSIYGPFYVAAGSLKPSNPRLVTVLLQLVTFTFLFPLTQGLMLLPLGIELALRFLGWPERAPVYLVLSLVECAVVVVIYCFSLMWQGHLLQSREQRILDIVTKRAA
jgi:hypothetical protein